MKPYHSEFKSASSSGKAAPTAMDPLDQAILSLSDMFLYWTLEHPPPPAHHFPLALLTNFAQVLLPYRARQRKRKLYFCVCMCVCVCVCVCVYVWHHFVEQITWKMEAVCRWLSVIVYHCMAHRDEFFNNSQDAGEVLPLDITFWCCWRCTVFCKLQTSHLSAMVCVHYGLQHTQLAAWELTIICSMEVNN